MYTQAFSNVIRTFVCTVGALALSSLFLFAAAGPAHAGDTVGANAGIIVTVSTARPIAY